MLRITTEKSAEGVRLIIEGRLVDPWVEELQTTVITAGALSESVQLDLSSVHFVDAEGLALLNFLQREGVRLLKVSPFVQELLK